MLLNEVPWEQLRTGDPVRSTVTKRSGEITELKKVRGGKDPEDFTIVITWSNGSQSYIWHFWSEWVEAL